MILGVLVRRYESMLNEGKVPRRGWGKAKVSFALKIDKDGALLRVVDLRIERSHGKKQVMVPAEIVVPERTKKSSGIVSQFLCENSAYFLALDRKGKPERTKECFRAASRLHADILSNCQSDMAVAIRNFFSHWDLHHAEGHPVLQDSMEEIVGGVNLVFMLDDRLATEDEAVRLAWEQHCNSMENAVKMQCLVTGEEHPIARLHPSVQGVRNAQPTGASLVSFNGSAYDSYGHDNGQGKNAPVSEYAAFAYTTALNALLGDKRHVQYLGNTTVVYWTEHDSELCQEFIDGFIFHDESVMDEETMNGYLMNLQRKEPMIFKGYPLDFDNPFYVLGVDANASRLAVRFFARTSIGDVLRNAGRYMLEISIGCPKNAKWEHVPLWVVLNEVPSLVDGMIESVFMETEFPVSLLGSQIHAIKHGQDNLSRNPPRRKVSFVQCAIIKAYLIRNGRREIPMSLDDNVNDVPYILGRIFAVSEHLQETARGGNTTFKELYFNAICATPARIFPVIQGQSMRYMHSLKNGLRVYFGKQLEQLMDKLHADTPLPQHFSMEEQGLFVLGYYHQCQARFTKKEEITNEQSN